VSLLVTERDRVLELVARHGWNATAFQTLESGYRYFFHGSEACVAYVDTGGAWVAAGAPIAHTNELGQAVSAFVQAARTAGKRCCFFATEERLHASTGEALRSLNIGEQPTWDPQAWPESLAQHRSLREQLRRARAKRVQVRLLSGTELEQGKTHEQLARIAERWLSARVMAPMGFLVRLEPFTFPAERRCFVAEVDGRVVAFAGVIPVPARGGWFLEDIVRDTSTPNGTSELLVDAVMRWARAAGCTWLTFGLAPLAGKLPEWLRFVRRTTSAFYDFEGLHAYKAKFRPSAWSPIFLSYPARQSLLLSVADALAAFTQGGVVRFGWRSLLRGPRLVLRALAILLVPWTALLMLVPAARFGAQWVKWGWIGFDICVALGLFRVLRKPAPRLLTALCVAVSADAVVTTLEASFWNLSRAERFADYFVLALACGAPSLAAIVLWGARRHRLSQGLPRGGDESRQ
jgi:phosphatidylglycerol lysyltransferase